MSQPSSSSWLMSIMRPSQITDAEILDLIISILDSPYANFLIRQFVLAAITKMSSRPTTSPAQQERIATLIAGYSTNPDLEIQQRGVEFSNLLALSDVKSGVLERMPAPELKATVMGYGWFRIFQTVFHPFIVG
jgi:AP-1 complex subunit gamma-1